MKVAWFHSHFYNFTGGHKFVIEVIKRFQNKADIELIIQNGTNENIQKVINEGIIVNNLNKVSTNSALFWLNLNRTCLNDTEKLQKILDKKNIDTLISCMFPTNYIASKLKSKRIFQYCYEPFPLFWDRHMISEFPLYLSLILRVLSFFINKGIWKVLKLQTKYSL